MQLFKLRITNRTSQYIKDSVKRGYPYECECGELYRDEDSAKYCRKCRIYLAPQPGDKVVLHHIDGGSR